MYSVDLSGTGVVVPVVLLVYGSGAIKGWGRGWENVGGETSEGEEVRQVEI